jgi:hypothetical protein
VLRKTSCLLQFWTIHPVKNIFSSSSGEKNSPQPSTELLLDVLVHCEEQEAIVERGGDTAREKAGIYARREAGVVPDGRAEAFSDEKEIAEVASTREVGGDTGLVLDCGGVDADADLGEEREGLGPGLGFGGVEVAGCKQRRRGWEWGSGCEEEEVMASAMVVVVGSEIDEGGRQRSLKGGRGSAPTGHMREEAGGERLWWKWGYDPPSPLSGRCYGSCWSSYSAAPRPFLRFRTYFRELLETA